MRKIVQINLASSEKLNFDKIKLILYPRVRNSMIYVPDNIVHKDYRQAGSDLDLEKINLNSCTFLFFMLHNHISLDNYR